MKHVLLVTTMLILGVLQSMAQYPLVTIRQIQEVSADSLRMLDTLQRTQLGRWTAQTSPYYHDTVRVRGVCVVPSKIINFTSYGFNFLIADTANPTYNGGLFVRPNLAAVNAGDTVLAIQWGVLQPQPGDYLELTGYIDEFPSGDPVSQTQIVPLYDQPLTVFPQPVAVPQFVYAQASQFWRGLYPSQPPYPPNGIQFSTGEPLEFTRVFLTHLTVISYVNQTNGTFQMVDQAGNAISTMDASKWFTLRGHRDPASTYALPAIGSVIDTIRGYMLCNSGQEAARGYRIAPLLPGDIVFGSVTLPVVSTHRRYPIVVPPDSTPTIACKITKGSVGILSAQLHYSLNNGPFVNVAMTKYAPDTTYRAHIPQEVANTFVRYYITATDSASPPNTVTLASSALDGSQSDTLRGFFFYTVLNRPITISDIQTTPYPNGRTPYLGANVTISGIITADSASLILPPARFRGTTAWYMQNGNQPWNGIWVYNDSLSPALLGLRNGDSASVTGYVAEDFDVTRIERQTSLPVVVSHSNPLPAPVVLTTGNFGPGVANGMTQAEQWEGMLVQFNNVVMTDSAPTYQELYEFAVDDGSGPVIVRRDGTNHFTTTVNDSVGKVLIPVGARIAYLRGIIYFGGAGAGFRYKLVPRSNDDFGPITTEVHVQLATNWNMISNPVTSPVPDDSATHLFPTIMSRAFRFQNGYFASDTLGNGIGYWGKFPAAVTSTITGMPRTRDSINVSAGWNMVGSISNPVDTATIVSVPPGLKASNWFGYSNGYVTVSQITPGLAYWIKTNAAGKFVFANPARAARMRASGVGSLDALSTLTVTDSRGGSQTLYFGADAKNEIPVALFDMPPQPPVGVLDARFATSNGGSMVRTYAGKVSGQLEFPVAVQSDAYPLTLTWEVKGAAIFELADDAGGRAFSPRVMNGAGSMKITNGQVGRFVVRLVSSGELPKEFALAQNYPNPFNPSTTIKYDLPVDAHVSLRVFNILGQEVVTLVNEDQKAGYRSVEWKASSLASGVYFYRLEAGNFTNVKKLVLLK